MTTWKFTATGIFANDHHVGASYSLAQNGDVYVYTGIVDPADGTTRIPVRLRIAPDMPSYAAAVEAAKAAEKAAAQPAKQAAPKAEKAAAQPAKQAAPKAEKAAAQPAKQAAPKAEKPAQPAKQAVPTDWVGSRIDGKGWYVVFDDAAKRTRFVFAQKPTDAQAAAIAAAGFYFSANMQSYNKHLTLKAYKAAMALVATLNSLAA
jgi:hypothetical protein